MEYYNEGYFIKELYLGVKFAFSYFTILPVKFSNNDDLSKSIIIKSMLFFLPFIGLVLGSLTILMVYITYSFQWLGLVLSSIFYMLLYGFLHTEAIVDVVDALYAQHSGKDPYKIIKESTIGAMGLLYAVAFVILKISIIVYMFEKNLYLEFIMIVVFSRLALLFDIKLFKIHQNSKFIHILKNNISLSLLIITCIVYGVIGFYLVSYTLFIVAISIAIVSIIITKILKITLGFVNGDVLGTSLEISEIVGICIILSLKSI